MVWVPAVYSSPALYLVNHPVQLGKWVQTHGLFLSVVWWIWSFKLPVSGVVHAHLYEIPTEYHVSTSCLSYSVLEYTVLYYATPILSLIWWLSIHRLSLQVSFYVLFGGLLCIYTQYNIDHQRQEFRETHGKAKVWGIFATKVWVNQLAPQITGSCKICSIRGKYIHVKTHTLSSHYSSRLVVFSP